MSIQCLHLKLLKTLINFMKNNLSSDISLFYVEPGYFLLKWQIVNMNMTNSKYFLLKLSKAEVHGKKKLITSIQKQTIILTH